MYSSQRKTWGLGPYARVDNNSHYLIVNSVVRCPPPLQRERVEWGRSLLLVGHIFICLLISLTCYLCQKEKGKYEEGGGKEWELTLFLELTFYEAWATPCLG